MREGLMVAKQPRINRLYEFGSFVLDPAEYLLTTNGTPVSLPPRAFDLLVVLVESDGRLMTKENLLNCVWQDVAVEEGNIPYNISLVRKALGDDAAAPRYVATVSKLGYRFIAPVKRLTEFINRPTVISTLSEHEDDPHQTTHPAGSRPVGLLDVRANS
jgi:DNA-binding winged helix-turn-helix (wHTH) protein